MVDEQPLNIVKLILKILDFMDSILASNATACWHDYTASIVHDKEEMKETLVYNEMDFWQIFYASFGNLIRIYMHNIVI